MSALLGTACGALADIEKLCIQHGLGISSTMEIIEAASLTSIPAPDASSHTISTDIVVDSGEEWYQWKLGATEAEFTATSIGSKGNQSFRNVLTIFLPFSRDAIDYLLNQMLNGEFIIRFGDKNGNKRILGTENSPAMIAEGGVQEVINEERNGVTITFENVGHTPYFYTGAVSFDPAA